MNARELRIGNWVDPYHNWKGQVQITEISNGRIIHTPCSVGGVSDISIKPIPLTEEWLRKFGFEHNEKQQIWNYADYADISFCISYNTERYTGFKLYVNHEYEEGEPFQYVHQLQNLYFALTGEELTLAA